MPTIALMTVGCKVNQYETEVLTELFRKEGYEIVPADAPADVYLLNSCTVTATGDQKTRQLLRRMKRINPSAVAVLTGCYPQAFPEAAAEIPEADVVTGELARGKIPELVKRALRTGERIVEIPEHVRGEAFEPMEVSALGSRTRAYVKIEDGCERYCAYCIIPKARGPIRSKPMADITRELTGLAAAGYKEVVLVGINLSSYGKEWGGRLIDAVDLACGIPGIKRVRLGSLEPELLSDGDIARMAAHPNFCPQFHLSLQSGCDRTLRSMNRHYDTAEYARIVRVIRQNFENPAITTDIMVGFPGETEEDFLDTLKLVKEVKFASLFTFIYSKREGTRAAKMEDPVPKEEKSRWFAMLLDAQRKIGADYYKGYVGKTFRVLCDGKSPLGLAGRTEFNAVIDFPGEESLIGRFLQVKVVSADKHNLTGEIRAVE